MCTSNTPNSSIKTRRQNVLISLVFSRFILHKWKNHFSEMKGMWGCNFMKKKGNKKMPKQRHKVVQPHPYIFVIPYA